MAFKKLAKAMDPNAPKPVPAKKPPELGLSAKNQKISEARRAELAASYALAAKKQAEDAAKGNVAGKLQKPK